MPLWKSLREYVESYPSVKKWALEHFSDENTRANYVWQLRSTCNKIGIKPDELLSLLNDGENPLFLKLKQCLEAESHIHNRTAHLMKWAVVSYCQYHNSRNTKFFLNITLPKKDFYNRDYQWGLREWEQLLANAHPKYRPLLRLGLMAGLGRKELIYLNRHHMEVKDVEKCSQAVMLSGIPERKKNAKKWTAILPKKEFKEYVKNAPVQTSGTIKRKPNFIEVDDLTANFQAAAKRAGFYVVGQSIHEGRRTFKSLGLSPELNIPERILDQNMGHVDSQGYDKTHLSFDQRAKTLQPLWEYMRQGGPPTATKTELTERDKQIDSMRKEINELKLGRLGPLSELDIQKMVEKYLASKR